MPPPTPDAIAAFRAAVNNNYRKQGRTTLPWRLNTEAWGVLVSEIMLQQTQIERVIPYWERWMRRWPTPEHLAAATLEDTLRQWSGLGYNRRARSLWDSAHRISAEFSGKVPETPQELITLPGIGPYSASAIACFAYNRPTTFIETNIRAAVIHHFYPHKTNVPDSDIHPILESALDRENPRLWHWALMDYGAAIKKETPNPNRRSAAYTRQTPFHGSFRQQRAAILRNLITQGPADAATLQRRTGIQRETLCQAIETLQKDLLVCNQDGAYKIKE